MRTAMTLAALLLPTAALAHPGHGAGFLAGLEHPLSGADHVLAMIAVGLFAAQRGGRALWAAPAAFVAAMLAGGALGFAGLPFPAVEPLILASGIILGIAVAIAARPPLPVTLAGIALFGLAHGHAHGTEGQGASLFVFAAGFTLATAALHGLGIAMGRSLSHSAFAQRVAGGVTAAAGLALVVAG